MRNLFSLSLFAALSLQVGCANSIRLQDQPVDSGTQSVEPDGNGGDAPLDDSGVEEPTSGGGENRAPLADAGPDLEGNVPQEIELDGSASSDPDGDILNYFWELVERPADSSAFLINETRSNASFYADRDGVYIARLTVDDNDLSSSDEVEINVAAPNEGPVANAGQDRTVTVGTRVVLDGTNSYDPDGVKAEDLTYQWTLVSRPTGSAAALDDRNSPVPAITVDVVGAYVVDLRVSDGVDISTVDQVRIIAQSANNGNDGCLSCAATELDRRFDQGNAAAAVGFALLPVFLIVALRRRRAGRAH